MIPIFEQSPNWHYSLTKEQCNCLMKFFTVQIFQIVNVYTPPYICILSEKGKLFVINLHERGVFKNL